MSGTQQFDFSVDLMRSILWQYEGALRGVALARNDQAWIDDQHSEFWRDWRRDVFDLATANEFGLSVWARILRGIAGDRRTAARGWRVRIWGQQYQLRKRQFRPGQ